MEQEKIIKLAVGCLSSAAVAVMVLAGLAWGMRPFYMPYVKAFMWDGSETFVCEVNEDISMSNKKADVSDGPAIEVHGNCQLECTNCELKGETGIDGAGNGRIKLEGGSVEASDTAFNLEGNSQLETKNVDIKAPVAIRVTGNAGAKVRGGKVEGTKFAVEQQGNGKVDMKKAAVSGAVEATREANVTTGT